MKDNNYDNLYAYYIQKFPAFMNIAQYIFRQSPLDYFAYQRLYLGGHHLILLSNQEYSKCFFNTVCDLGDPFSRRIKRSKINTLEYHVWPSAPDTWYLQDMYKYKIWEGLTIHIRKSNYVDVYYFGTSKEINNHPEMVNFYLNKTDLFKNFINFFNCKADSIINVKDKKILGKHTGSIILESFEDDENSLTLQAEMRRRYVSIDGREIYLTAQEFNCIKTLSKGYSSKFAGKILNLSPRTVESYLQSVKYKTGLQSSDLLLKWFHEEVIMASESP